MGYNSTAIHFPHSTAQKTGFVWWNKIKKSQNFKTKNAPWNDTGIGVTFMPQLRHAAYWGHSKLLRAPPAAFTLRDFQTALLFGCADYKETSTILARRFLSSIDFRRWFPGYYKISPGGAGGVSWAAPARSLLTSCTMRLSGCDSFPVNSC